MFSETSFPLLKYKSEPNSPQNKLFSLQDIDEIVLHIDVNGTIIAEDKAGGESPEDFIEKLVERAKKQGRSIDEQMLNEIKRKLATNEGDAEIFIFPSLFRLLERLDAEQVRYKVKIRTFGLDLPEITSEIKRKRPGIEFAHLELRADNCDAMTQRQIHSDTCLEEQWVTVQENYEHWNTQGRNAEVGKQLCLNQNPRIFDVFFDDCIARKDLIHVVDPDGNTMQKTEAVARGHLVNIDTLEAIYDDSYFIKQLVKASDKYSDSMQFEALHLLKLNQ